MRAEFLQQPLRVQSKCLWAAFRSQHPGLHGEEALFRRWVQAESAAPGGVHGARARQMREWQEFITGRRFGAVSIGKLPERRGWASEVAMPLIHWICWGSWRFCKRCGHVRPDARLSSLSRPAVHDVDIECSAKVMVSCQEPDIEASMRRRVGYGFLYAEMVTHTERHRHLLCKAYRI